MHCEEITCPYLPARLLLLVASAGFLIALSACASPPPSAPPESRQSLPQLTTPDATVPGLNTFEIQATESELRMLVMRGGLLSRFGHNHVIGGPVISGQILLAPDLTDSSFRIAIDLASLQIDNMDWRQQEGEAFASTPSEEDIAGTRENMLGELVLDVAQYPRATIRSAAILGQLPEFSVLARITLKDRTKSIPVSIKAEIKPERLSASGEFTLTQSDFGIEPFSVLLGAISVQDDILIRFNIVAQRND